MTPLPKLVDANGLPLVLDQLLATGGEGAVFTLMKDATRVAKVYHKPPTDEKIEKLTAMAALATPNLLQVTAWPEQLAFDKSGTLVGFVMPRLVDYQPLQHLYNPVQRLKHFPRAGWNFQVRAARNCAAAFDEIHTTGCIIGDINQSNVQVSAQALVKFIDCDSFQIEANNQHYLCEVGVAHYTPPELQGQSFRGLIRTANHDHYGLAVLIFQLLFVGRHPYAGIYQGTDDPSFEQFIAEYRFAHGPSASKWQMAPPPFTPSFADIPRDLGNLFRRAFERGSGERPTASEWITNLKELEATIADCPADEGHKHWVGAKSCPWCRFAQSGGPEYYYGVSNKVEVFVVDEQKVQDVVRRLSAVETVEYSNLRHAFAPSGPIVARPVSRQIRMYTLTSRLLVGMVFALFVSAFFMQKMANDWVNNLISIVSLCGAILFVYRTINSPWSEEKKLRKQGKGLARDQMNEVVGKYNTIYHRFESLRLAESRVVTKLIAEWRALGTTQRDEIQRLTKLAEQRALKRYLKLFDIAEATIPSIGRARKKTLADNHILSASDIDPSVILSIKGFGPAAVESLTVWRDAIAQTFRFDPSTAVSSGEQLTITLRLRERQSNLERDIERRLRDLEYHGAECKRQLSALEPEIRDAVANFEQAAADARLMGVK